MTEESAIWNQAQQWVKKGIKHPINVMWELKVQKLATLSAFRVCDSIFKKNIKREIAVVGAGNDSRPKGGSLLVPGQGEGQF